MIVLGDFSQHWRVTCACNAGTTTAAEQLANNANWRRATCALIMGDLYRGTVCCAYRISQRVDSLMTVARLCARARMTFNMRSVRIYSYMNNGTNCVRGDNAPVWHLNIAQTTNAFRNNVAALGVISIMLVRGFAVCAAERFGA